MKIVEKQNMNYLGNGVWRKSRKGGYVYYIEKTSCKSCGEAYLTQKYHQSDFCSMSCALIGENNPNFGKILSEEE